MALFIYFTLFSSYRICIYIYIALVQLVLDSYFIAIIYYYGYSLFLLRPRVSAPVPVLYATYALYNMSHRKIALQIVSYVN